MKCNYLALLLGLFLLLTACGETGGAASTGPTAAEPETFGAADLDSAPEPMAETTAQAASQEPQNSDEAVKPSAFTELDQQAVISALVSEAVDGQPYDRLGSGYFWRAVGYLAGQGGAGVPMEDGQVELTEDQLKPVVAALFGPYEEQYPSLSEEDPLVTQEYVDGAYRYRVTSMGPFDHTVELGDPQPQGDGTYHCQAKLLLGGEVLAGYTVTLTDYAGEPEQGYSYSILGIEKE